MMCEAPGYDISEIYLFLTKLSSFQRPRALCLNWNIAGILMLSLWRSWTLRQHSDAQWLALLPNSKKVLI